MDQRPVPRNESQDVTPAKAGVHLPGELDSRFRGNDVTCDRAPSGVSGGIEAGKSALTPLSIPGQKQMLPQSIIDNPPLFH
jgi:hypothetical protein